MAEILQFFYVFDLDGVLERVGEVGNSVVDGGLQAVVVVGEVADFVRSLVLVRDTFRLRTCGAGVAQVEHPSCKQ